MLKPKPVWSARCYTPKLVLAHPFPGIFAALGKCRLICIRSSTGPDACRKQSQGGQEPKETSSREGDQYQAAIPAQIGKRPAPGREEDDPHCGIPGPSTEQALALAKGPELAAARALPPDATSDILLGTVRSVLLHACNSILQQPSCSSGQKKMKSAKGMQQLE